jgi:hypothetical protein
MLNLTVGRILTWAVGVAVAVLVIWVGKVNYALSHTPQEALKAAPKRWTQAEILETFKRMGTKSVVWKDLLPPMMERRYIVVGGGGKLFLYIYIHIQTFYLDFLSSAAVVFTRRMFNTFFSCSGHGID